MPKLNFIAGMLTGAAWSLINLLLIINLLKIAILQKSKLKLSMLLLLKFPVLYLLGFLILVSHIFPISSLLIGAIIILLVIGVRNICLRRI